MKIEFDKQIIKMGLRHGLGAVAIGIFISAFLMFVQGATQENMGVIVMVLGILSILVIIFYGGIILIAG